MKSVLNNKLIQNYDYPYVKNTSVLLFCGYVIIWYLQIGYRIPLLGSIRFEMIYAIVLTVIAMFSNLKVDLDNPLTKQIIIFIILIFIQVPLSYNVQVSWIIFLNRVIKFAFMAFFIVSYIQKPKHLLWFIYAFIFACMKMGQEGFVGQLTGSLVWQNQGIMRLHGATPNYSHPNSFSGMAIGTLPFIIYLFPIVNKYLKSLSIIQLLFSLNIVLFTGSRTGYVAFILMILIVIFQNKNKNKIFLICIITIIITIPAIPKDYSERFGSIFTGQEKEGSSSESRLIILKDSIEIFLKNPLGVGVGAFPYIRKDLYGRFQDTHNLYFEIATNLGIQGLICFILLIYNTLKMLSNTNKSCLKQIEIIKKYLINSPKDNSVHLYKIHLNDLFIIKSASNAVYLFICARLLLGLFGMDLYEIYWWFSIGLSISLYNINKLSSKKTEYISNIASIN